MYIRNDIYIILTDILLFDIIKRSKEYEYCISHTTRICYVMIRLIPCYMTKMSSIRR